MNLVRCNNGHFYDANSFTECPHCKAVGEKGETIPSSGRAVTSGMQETADVSLQNAVNKAMSRSDFSKTDEKKTVGFFSRALGKEPVVGWLIAIEGQHLGEDFRLVSGRNFIGRSTAMDICLSKDATVSRDKHAVIVYDPRQNTYLVQPGDSKELFYLNDEVVLSPMKIKRNDILSVGEAKLMFFPCCDEVFFWNRNDKE